MVEITVCELVMVQAVEGVEGGFCGVEEGVDMEAGARSCGSL